MYTTQLDNGTLNNYAVEPEMTYAEYPGFYQQRRYLQQGAIALRAPAKLIAALFVTAIVFISFAVS